MAKLAWKKFVNDYPNSPGYGAQVSRTLPGPTRFDRKSQKLPTPYV